jgi:hypothetical protein
MEIGELVQQARLGTHRATYPAVLMSPGRLGVGWAITGVAGLIAIAGLVTGEVVLLILGGIPALFLAYRMLRLASLNRQKEGQQLLFFDQGLICVGAGGRLSVRRWDSCTVYQNTVRHYRNGGYTHTTYSYRLIGPDGDTLGLAGGFQNPAEWGQRIQQAVTEAQLPRAIGALRQGAPLTFGDITLTRDGVFAGKKSVPWPQVQEIRVKDGTVSVRVAGKWLSLTRTMVRDIPNFFLFYEVAERLRLAAARPA